MPTNTITESSPAPDAPGASLPPYLQASPLAPGQHAREFKLLPIFTGLFVTVLILSNVLASKFIALGPFNAGAGILIFPISYIFNDMFTEVYGFHRSRKIIWIGMGCQAFSAFMFWLVGIFPAAPFWHNQEAYNTILGSTPRILVASLAAFCCGEFFNSLVMSKMKYWQHGARGLSQGYRFVASTIVGEAIDSAIFYSLAFYGVFSTTQLLNSMLTMYVCKVIYEVAAVPLTTRFTNWVKRVEGIDKIDLPQETDYNPFSLATDDQPARA